MNTKTSITLALSTTIAASVALGNVQAADGNPFSVNKLDRSSLQLAEDKIEEMKCGAGACGGSMNKAADGNTASSMPPDADQDGKITKAEFVTFHSQLFDKADSNKDGILDASEMQAMHKTMAEGMCGGKMESTKPENAAENAPKTDMPAEKAVPAK